MRKPRLDQQEYLELIEVLAKKVVEAANAEGTFEIFLEEGAKTPLQSAITELAQNLRYWHEEGDGCVDADE